MVINQQQLNQWTQRCPKCGITFSKDLKECPLCSVEKREKKSIKRIKLTEALSRKGTKDAEKLRQRPVGVKYCKYCLEVRSVIAFRSKGWNRKRTIILLSSKCRYCEKKDRWAKQEKVLDKGS